MIRGRYLTSMDDIGEVVRLREEALAGEPGYGGALSDPYDGMAIFALAMDENMTPSAMGRLYIDDCDRFRIGPVCVAPGKRRQGFGDLVMRMLLARALDLGAPSVYCECPANALNFLARYGLKPVSDVYEINGAPFRMTRALAGEISLEGTCASSAAPCAACQGGCAGCQSQSPSS